MAHIPASTGFRPRAALLYVPPAVRRHPQEQLPVLELLHGTPGQPAQWFINGNLLATADAFAAHHHGRAPLIVVPDLNGSEAADSECIRTAAGADVETYLTTDVVRWVRRHYAREVGNERWWIAGLSEGGVCSLMLALRHRELYSAFGDFSGLIRPTVGRVSPLASDRQLYQGNVLAQREHDPLWLLSHGRYAGMRAFFECGVRDLVVRAAQLRLAAAASRAGLTVRAVQHPGRHGWTVWTDALRDLLPWLWSNAT